MATKTKISLIAAAACVAIGTSIYRQRDRGHGGDDASIPLRRKVISAHPAPGTSPGTDFPVVDGEKDMTGNTRISGNKKPGSAAETHAGKGFVALNSYQESSSGLEESTRLDKPEGAASRRAVPMVNGKVKWHHTQATGAPDTPKAGDSPTAWAPNRQSGEQWLALGYEKAVEIKEINIYETHCPGGISKVTALAPDGSEKVLWQGTAAQPNAGEDSLETSLAVPAGITASRINVYVDTDRVGSWREIDAVELVGTNGSRQWASNSRASSSYSEVFYDEPSPGEESDAKAEASTGPAPKPPGPDAVSGASPLK